METDYFRDFVPHIEKINFEDPIFEGLVDVPTSSKHFKHCQLAANNISRQILELPENNRFDYWDEYEGMEPLDIELLILREQMRDRWAEVSKHGRPCYLHGLTALKLMFPDTDITPSLADVTYLSMGMFQHRRKYLNLIGSMDAGKSSSTARLAWLYAAIDSENFFAITATPTVKSASMTIFGDMTELYEELSESHPADEIFDGQPRPYLFPKSKNHADRQIALFPGALNKKGGWMIHRSLKSGGIGIGAKGKGKDTRFGVGLYIADEVNNIDNFERFKKDLPNASKQGYFQLHTTQNPLDPTDEGGQMCEPKQWLDWGVATFKEVREDDSLIWPTVNSGIAYRFDGLRSVNLVLGKTVYPYLFNKIKHDQTVEDYGKESPQYMSQVRAMFHGQDVQSTLLSRSKLAASRHEDEWFTLHNVKGRVLSCDPAHTGLKDKAVITSALWGDALVENVDGSQEITELLIFQEYQLSVKNLLGFYWDNESDFFQRFLNVGGKANALTMGTMVTYEQQIALAMAERAVKEGCPFRNVFYDSSMRPDMVSAVNQCMGFEPVAMPLIDKPVGFQLIDTRKNTVDRCRNVNEEALFLAADVVAGKAVRGGNNIPLALRQISMRRIDMSKPHHPPEKKIDFKDRNGGQSPDHGDSFAYLVWGAYLRGFRAESTIDHRKGNETPFRKLQQSKRHQSKTGKKFRK